MRLNKLSEAEHWYRESLRSKPDHIPAHLTYGKLLAVTVSLAIFFSSSSSPFPVVFGLLRSLACSARWPAPLAGLLRSLACSARFCPRCFLVTGSLSHFRSM